MSHLVIHCGGPKTGSSALQYTLGTARESLNAAGLDYPLVTDETDPTRPSTGNASSIPRQWKEFAASPTGGNIFEERTERLLATLCETAPATVVIFSSEYFSDLTDAEWRKVFDILMPTGRTISAITYFRAQAPQINSIFGQFIKSGFRPDPANFVTYSLQERLCLAPHAYVTRLKAFPFATVDAGVYARAHLAGGDVTADFLDRLARATGARVPDLVTRSEVNPSFNGTGLSMKYALNVAKPSIPENYAIIRALERVPWFRAGARGPEFVLPEQEVLRIERHFAADNARAADAFGPAFETLCDPRPEAVTYSDATEAPSAEAVEAFWTAWQATVTDAWPKRARIMQALEPRLVAALEEATRARA